MENNASHLQPAAIALPSDTGAIWIIAASAQSWPELICLDHSEILPGDDGLIRFALWSASKCSATLLATRRASLCFGNACATQQIRSLVIANAKLTTQRPLTGFLLKPVETLNCLTSCGAPSFKTTGRAPQEMQIRNAEIKSALFDAFPVNQNGEPPPRVGAFTP